MNYTIVPRQAAPFVEIWDSTGGLPVQVEVNPPVASTPTKARLSIDEHLLAMVYDIRAESVPGIGNPSDPPPPDGLVLASADNKYVFFGGDASHPPRMYASATPTYFHDPNLTPSINPTAYFTLGAFDGGNRLAVVRSDSQTVVSVYAVTASGLIDVGSVTAADTVTDVGYFAGSLAVVWSGGYAIYDVSMALDTGTPSDHLSGNSLWAIREDGQMLSASVESTGVTTLYTKPSSFGDPWVAFGDIPDVTLQQTAVVTPDGNIVCAVGSGMCPQLYAVTASTIEKTIAYPGTIDNIGYVDNEKLVLSRTDGTWLLERGLVTFENLVEQPFSYTGTMSPYVFSPDGNRVIGFESPYQDPIDCVILTKTGGVWGDPVTLRPTSVSGNVDDKISMLWGPDGNSVAVMDINLATVVTIFRLIDGVWSTFYVNGGAVTFLNNTDIVVCREAWFELYRFDGTSYVILDGVQDLGTAYPHLTSSYDGQYVAGSTYYGSSKIQVVLRVQNDQISTIYRDSGILISAYFQTFRRTSNRLVWFNTDRTVHYMDIVDGVCTPYLKQDMSQVIGVIRATEIDYQDNLVLLAYEVGTYTNAKIMTFMDVGSLIQIDNIPCGETASLTGSFLKSYQGGITLETLLSGTNHGHQFVSFQNGPFDTFRLVAAYTGHPVVVAEDGSQVHTGDAIGNYYHGYTDSPYGPISLLPFATEESASNVKVIIQKDGLVIWKGADGNVKLTVYNGNGVPSELHLLNGTFVSIYENLGTEFKERDFLTLDVGTSISDMVFSTTDNCFSFFATNEATESGSKGRYIFDIRVYFKALGLEWQPDMTRSFLSFSPADTHFAATYEQASGNRVVLYKFQDSSYAYAQTDQKNVDFGPVDFSNCNQIVVAHGGSFPFTFYSTAGDILTEETGIFTDWSHTGIVLDVKYIDCNTLAILTPDEIIAKDDDSESSVDRDPPSGDDPAGSTIVVNPWIEIDVPTEDGTSSTPSSGGETYTLEPGPIIVPITYLPYVAVNIFYRR